MSERGWIYVLRGVRRLLFAAIPIAAIGIVIAVVLQLGQKSIDLHSGSSPQTAKANFIIEHDGKYQIAYTLHHCEGTELSVANVSVGGLNRPRPNTFQLVTATSVDEVGTRTLPLYYGNWQVIESGKTAECSWSISVKPVAF